MLDLAHLPPAVACYVDPSGYSRLRSQGVIDARGGALLLVPSTVDRGTLVVLATTSDGWDHVSVSRKNRCPNWAEMEQIKRLLFLPTETAMQLHVPPAQHVNHHPYCLHLWRPQHCQIPLPNPDMVAPVGA